MITDTTIQPYVTIKRKQSIDNAEQTFKQALADNGLSDVKPEQILNLAYMNGYIDADKYDKAIGIVNDLKDSEKGPYKSDQGFWYNLVSTFWKKDTHTKYAELYNTMTELVPKFKEASNVAMSELPDHVFQKIAPGLSGSGVEAPSYLNTNFKIRQREVDPVKLWTGQELADLHDINYDVNYYYDLIKQGTEANLNYGKYTNAQALNTARRNDANRVVAYLDSLRNVRSEALAEGATAGYQAANEVLGNVSASTTRANTVAETLNNNLANIDNYILKNAQAKLSAVDYFNQLAQSLSKDSATLYQNDTNRYGADWNSNAVLYAADQKLRAERALANATMYADQLKANSAINAYRQSSGANDLYEYLKYASATSSNPIEAYSKVNDLIIQSKTGHNSVLDYLTAD